MTLTPREHYARVKHLFQAVESLPAEQQLQALQRQCEGDQSLYDDVKQLLDCHDPEAAIREGQTVIGPENQQTIIRSAERRGFLRPEARLPGWLNFDPQTTAVAVVAVIGCIVAITAAMISMRQVSASVSESLQNELPLQAKALSDAVTVWMDRHSQRLGQLNLDPELTSVVQSLVQASAEQSTEPEPDDIDRLNQWIEQRIGQSESQAEVVYALWTSRGKRIAGTGDSDGAVAAPSAVTATIAGLKGVQLHWPSEESKTLRSNSGISNQLWCSMCVMDESQRTLEAVLVLSVGDWQAELQQVIEQSRNSELTDTFLVDSQGVVVSCPQTAEQWFALDILESEAPTAAIGTVRVGDPGGRLASGYRSTRSRKSLPLTESVAQATVGEQGASVEGYADIRGERVVGAWCWNQRWGVGAIVEQPYQDAYALATTMQRVLGALLLIPLATLGACLCLIRWLSPSQDAGESEGQMAGAYELLDKIGEGGMGYVFRARHRLLKRPSAVKVLRPDRLTTVDVGRFDREVKLAAQLTSPHTVQIFDYGRTDDGLIYFAMEYLDGLTLSHLVARSGSLPLPRALHFLIHLCRSIEEAHTAGLVHRDIKPQNLMVTRRGNEADWLIVFDFGLAKSVAPDGKEFRTRENIWAGTPMFMSPERIRKPAEVDPRMDVYAIGAVGYLLLTGQDPFTASNPEMIFEQVLNVMPKPPSQVGADSTGAVDALLLRCMAKEQNDRPESVTVLRTRLEQLAIEYPWTAEQARVWWAEHGRD